MAILAVDKLLDVLDWLSVVSKLLNFPDKESLAIVLEGIAGMVGIVLEKGTSLELFDDDESVFNLGCCLGKLAAMCRRDCDEEGGRWPLELGGEGVPQADLLVVLLTFINKKKLNSHA